MTRRSIALLTAAFALVAFGSSCFVGAAPTTQPDREVATSQPLKGADFLRFVDNGSAGARSGFLRSFIPKVSSRVIRGTCFLNVDPLARARLTFQNGSLKPGGIGMPAVRPPIFSCVASSTRRTASFMAAATRSSSMSFSSPMSDASMETRRTS